MISDKAIIGENVTIPADCMVWHGATICDGATLGAGVVVGSFAYVGRGCRIGTGTRIQHGAFIPNHTSIGCRVFIGPNVSLTDDKYPRAGQPYTPQPPILEDDCSLGAGCVILPGVRIGKGVMIGAGSVVTKDILPFQTVKGVPAGPTPTT